MLDRGEGMQKLCLATGGGRSAYIYSSDCWFIDQHRCAARAVLKVRVVTDRDTREIGNPSPVGESGARSCGIVRQFEIALTRDALQC